MTKIEQSKYIGLKMLFLFVLANVGEKDNSAANEHNDKIKARTELKKYFKIKKVGARGGIADWQNTFILLHS